MTIVSVARSSVKWPVVGRGKRKEFRGPGLTQLIWRMGLSLHPEHGHCLRIYELVLRVTRAYIYTHTQRQKPAYACDRVYRVILAESNKKHPRAPWDGGVRSPFGKWRDPLVQLNLPDNGHQLSALETLRKSVLSVSYRFKTRNLGRWSETCRSKIHRAKALAKSTGKFSRIFSSLSFDD